MFWPGPLWFLLGSGTAVPYPVEPSVVFYLIPPARFRSLKNRNGMVTKDNLCTENLIHAVRALDKLGLSVVRVYRVRLLTRLRPRDLCTL